MASGFVSNVYQRLFHGKDRDRKSKTPTTTTSPPSSPHSHSSSSHPSSSPSSDVFPSTPPPSTSSSPLKSGQKKQGEGKGRNRGREGEISTPSTHTPTSSPASSSTPTTPTTPHVQSPRKAPLLSSLRKKSRPLSCIAARPDSPPLPYSLPEGAWTQDPQQVEEEQENSRPGILKKKTNTNNQEEKKKEKKQQQEKKQEEKKKKEKGKENQKLSQNDHQQQEKEKEKKPRRPLSCIVQPPSPQLMPSAQSHPELLPTSSTESGGPTRASAGDVAGNNPQKIPPRDGQRRPRPVSCFVQFPPPPPHSPPPYPLPSRSSTEAAATAAWSHVTAAWSHGTDLPLSLPSYLGPPPYLEASRRPHAENVSYIAQSRVDDLTPQVQPGFSEPSLAGAKERESSCAALGGGSFQLQERSWPQSGLYSAEDGRQGDSYPAQDTRQAGVYAAEGGHQSRVYSSQDRLQPESYITGDRQQLGAYSSEDRRVPEYYPSADTSQAEFYPSVDRSKAEFYPAEDRRQSTLYYPEDRHQQEAYSTDVGHKLKTYLTEDRREPEFYPTENGSQPQTYSSGDRQRDEFYPAEGKLQPKMFYSSENGHREEFYPAGDTLQTHMFSSGDGHREQFYPAEQRRQRDPYPSQTSRQPRAVTCSSPTFLGRGGRCGDARCFLDPCPYRAPPPSSSSSSQPPVAGRYTYDLQSYFPRVSAPGRRNPNPNPRPQSACFVCEPRPCYLQNESRPRSQMHFPEWSWPAAPDSGPALGPSIAPKLPSGTAASEAQDSRLAPPEESLPWSGASCSGTNPPPVDVDGGRMLVVPPRPARRTQVIPRPRPKSSCLLSLAGESEDVSPLSSPAPSPRPRRFPLKKYRSADCLESVDEAQDLSICPPAPKPLSHFTRDRQRVAAGQDEEVFTSTEMLQKVGLPRPPHAPSSSSSPSNPSQAHAGVQRFNKPRPVSCLVTMGGSSADESGYLSNATPAGSGWLGGLSASTGDILELMLDPDMGMVEGRGGVMVDVMDDDEEEGRSSSFRKAWSTCSLLSQDSVQDRSFTVMRRRRQRMKERRQTTTTSTTGPQSSSTDTDDGMDVGRKEGGRRGGGGEEEASSYTTTTTLSPEEGGESASVAGIPLEGKVRVPLGAEGGGVGGRVVRLHSTHMKAWQIRLRRKQMMKKRRGYRNTSHRDNDNGYHTTSHRDNDNGYHTTSHRDNNNDNGYRATSNRNNNNNNDNDNNTVTVTVRPEQGPKLETLV